VFTSKISIAIALAVLATAFTGGVARADGIPLGIVLLETPQGIQVTQVLPGGIADRCMPRLRPGASIVTLNGLPVKSADDFKRVIDTSTFVRFEFIDPTGASRWARAWTSGNAPSDAKPCYIIGMTPQSGMLLGPAISISPMNCLNPRVVLPCFIR
jgi:hypothetical protein